MVDSKDKGTLSPPGRCGFQPWSRFIGPHRIGAVRNPGHDLSDSAYQTVERWFRFPNRTGADSSSILDKSGFGVSH